MPINRSIYLHSVDVFTAPFGRPLLLISTSIQCMPSSLGPLVRRNRGHMWAKESERDGEISKRLMVNGEHSSLERLPFSLLYPTCALPPFPLPGLFTPIRKHSNSPTMMTTTTRWKCKFSKWFVKNIRIEMMLAILIAWKICGEILLLLVVGEVHFPHWQSTFILHLRSITRFYSLYFGRIELCG